MLHEYAVEPESLARFNAIWQAFEQFGVPHGRLIADFRRGWWKRDVWEATSASPDVERKGLFERLRRLELEKKLIYSDRKYDRRQTWRQNAHARQSEKPFRAIIQSDNQENVEFVLTEQDLIEPNPLWNVQHQVFVERTADAIAACVTPLGAISKEIMFVDPFFSIE